MGQPQITPGSGGYLAPIQQTNWANPWAGVAQSDQAVAQAGVTQGTQNLNGMMTQAGTYASQSAPYPSFPNSAGLGSQSAFGPAPAPAPAPQMDQGVNPGTPPMQLVPDTASRGANPWTFLGESNAR